MTPVDRFMGFVSPEPTTGCWLWTGHVAANGYGTFKLNGRTVLAHRFAHENFCGPIPDGLHLDHLCRVRSCVNPEHTEPVTCGENIRRGLTGKWQSERTHCPQGHEYTSENTGNWRGHKICRECKKIYQRELRAKRGNAINARRRELYAGRSS
jgi:hypothetical protein